MPTIFIVDQENKAVMSAVKKIAEAEARPGAVVLLTAAEFKAVTSNAGMVALDVPAKGKCDCGFDIGHPLVSRHEKSCPAWEPSGYEYRDPRE